MKRKEFISFWAGFLITAAVVAWLYWLWQQRREVTPQPLVISSSQPERRKPIPEEKTPESDDLTVIKGIGPVFAGRLNRAGIFTYTQLAAQSPDKLETITQVIRWDPVEWIAEAKKLA